MSHNTPPLAYGFGIYGMWGPASDPGERQFTDRVKALGVDVGESPYRDYEVGRIVDAIKSLPPDAKVILWGSSLGANNCPIVSAYIPRRQIAGMWGFQASDHGAKQPIGSNVLFAHEIYNPVWLLTFGLGHYRWTKPASNTETSLIVSKHYALHPGETPKAQAMFLAEMKRVIAH